MTLIKELIDIPEKVQRGDFVLNLASGVVDAERTVAEYVVTPQLQRSFDDALAFIKSAVTGSQQRSKGAYLHGSFGSGKSHFMAILHLLLQGHPRARGITELGAIVAKHDDWLRERRFLLVPYHMIGAASLEAGVLGGYLRHIRTLHPDAPVPGFYLSTRLFADAEKSRQHMGDEAFFAALNDTTHASSDNGWGEVDSGWDSDSYAAALRDDAKPEDRQRLVGDLVGTLFTSYADLANREQGGYVDFDQGLGVLCNHARDLGYDAVVLFLDELILWLASRLSDRSFIGSEIQKVVKLVEASQPRSLPLVNFIARQRDLREFVGDQLTGSEQEILSDSLKYWEGRFHTIKLEDRNLPVIAQKRLLAPISPAAKAQLDDAFATTERMRAELFDVLLTAQGDRDMFRQVYPFSPALIQALVALSSALQRERTALKVMLMLLVEQRDTLQLGQLIPVGDLYEVIATEAEPFSEQMRFYFDNARRLYERKLLPLLEAEHGVDAEARTQAFRNDERLLKTLLLAALVPEVDCFKQLTGTRLAALNHGSIKSPIPGREAQLALQKCRKWASQVGEIKIADDEANATIAIQLTGVDTETILEQARSADSLGNRKKLIKRMVYELLGIDERDSMWQEDDYTLLWRGSKRSVEVLFQNIREIRDESQIRAQGDGWKFIIDFPFDDDSYSPRDDEAKLEAYLQAGVQCQTVCWMPYFLSQAVQRDLGRLVVIDHVLRSDERFDSYSRHLSPLDRTQARLLLENQRSQLHQRLRLCLEGAYGISEAQPDSLDESHQLKRQVVSLAPTFEPRLPVGATPKDAFQQLIGQALAHQFPAHPEIEVEVRLADLGKIFEQLRRAIPADNGRIGVDRPLRAPLAQIAQPLGLGTLYENHFVFSTDWPQFFQRELDKTPREITVARLRAITDLPKPRGLSTPLQNLLIMVFAEHGQYAFSLRGGAYELTLKDLPDELVLVRQTLPPAQAWQQAVKRAGELFGLAPSSLLTANNLAKFNQDLRDKIKDHLDPCRKAQAEIERRQQALGIDQQDSNDRAANARLAVNLLEDLQQCDETEWVEWLAEFEYHNSAAALGRAITSAGQVAKALSEANWRLLEGVWNNPDYAQGQELRQRLRQALTADELASPIDQVLKQAEREATALLTRPPAKPKPQPAIPPTPQGQRVVAARERQGLDGRALGAAFQEIEQALGNDQRRTVNLSWQIIEAQDGE